MQGAAGNWKPHQADITFAHNLIMAVWIDTALILIWDGKAVFFLYKVVFNFLDNSNVHSGWITVHGGWLTLWSGKNSQLNCQLGYVEVHNQYPYMTIQEKSRRKSIPNMHYHRCMCALTTASEESAFFPLPLMLTVFWIFYSLFMSRMTSLIPFLAMLLIVGQEMDGLSFLSNWKSTLRYCAYYLSLLLLYPSPQRGSIWGKHHFWFYWWGNVQISCG